MSGPRIHFDWPTIPRPIPSKLPHILPPPVKEGTLRSPFGINKHLYNFALQPWIPLTFAAVYIVTVFALNSYNTSRDQKPWRVAKRPAFQWFVVGHNLLLALFSIATFVALFNAIRKTWPDGGLMHNPNGAAGVADALCKLHGPRGLGDAATFNTTIDIWEVKNTAIKLGYDGNPDPTDVGRLWNEGLAFWGWMFYISKFYDVLDTFIILAKGKRSATLQTYHHAGALLCMWAGIRYMSPPIWMFVFINSAIHAMMYIYFTFSALGYKVSQSLKRTLTSLQIAQFVFGAAYAAAHLFVAYDIPIATPYYILSTIQKAASSASSAASAASAQAKEATSTISKLVASPTASGTIGALVKKMLLRAAGEEGLAERVRNPDTGNLVPFPPDPAGPRGLEEKMERFADEVSETRWHTEWTKVHCIDTSGEAFAIYLNLLYLAPLTWLFLRFFFRAYTQRGKPRSPSQAVKQTKESSIQAEKDTERKFEQTGQKLEDELRRNAPGSIEDLKKDAKDVYAQLKKDVEQVREGTYKGTRRVSDRVASFERQVKTTADKAKEKGKELVNALSSKNGHSKDDSAGREEPVDDHVKTEEGGDGEKAYYPQQGEQPQPGSELSWQGAANGEEDKENLAPSGTGANNEPAEKQDENMDDSKAVRDGASDEFNLGQSGDKEAERERQGKDGGILAAGTRNEPEVKQDKNLADSQATRPGIEEDDEQPAGDDNDTDAMGKSGSIIDLGKEKAKEARYAAQGEDDKEEGYPKEGAKPAGSQSTSPDSTAA